MLGLYDGSIYLKNFTKLTSSYSSFIFSFAQKDVQTFLYLRYIFLTGLSIFFSSSSASIFSITSDISYPLTFPSSIWDNARMSFTAWIISRLGSATTVEVIFYHSSHHHVYHMWWYLRISLLFSLNSFFPVEDCVSHSYFLICILYHVNSTLFLYLLVAWSLFDYVIFWVVIIKFLHVYLGKKYLD